MSMVKFLLSFAILVACTNYEVSGFVHKPAKIFTHQDLNNAEKWNDYFRSTTLGKMYHLYHDVKEAGLDIRDFSLYEYEDHPNLQTEFKHFEYDDWILY